MNTKSVLTHLIRAGRDALHLEKTLTEIGYNETPYFNLYGEITDAIYGILGEQTDTIEESKAYAAIHDPFTPDEICAEELAMLVNVPAVPNETMDVISETALSRGMDPPTLVRLILNEWAMKKMFSKSVLG